MEQDNAARRNLLLFADLSRPGSGKAGLVSALPMYRRWIWLIGYKGWHNSGVLCFLLTGLGVSSGSKAGRPGVKFIKYSAPGDDRGSLTSMGGVR